MASKPSPNPAGNRYATSVITATTSPRSHPLSEVRNQPRTGRPRETPGELNAPAHLSFRHKRQQPQQRVQGFRWVRFQTWLRKLC